MMAGILIGSGATLGVVFILWLAYACGVEVERKRNKKEEK